MVYKKEDFVQVEAKRLDGIITQNINLIKIDVEGAESLVIDGMGDLKKAKPIAIVENHEENRLDGKNLLLQLSSD